MGWPPWGRSPAACPGSACPRWSLSADLLMKLFPVAFSIFVVILAQSAATSRAYAARYKERFSENIGPGGPEPGQPRGRTFRRLRGQRQPHRLGDGGQRRRPQPVGPDHQQHHRPLGAPLPDGPPGLHAGRGPIRGGLPHLRGPRRRPGDAPDLPGAARRILGGPHHRGHRGPGGGHAGHPAGHVPVAGEPHPARLPAEKRGDRAGPAGRLEDPAGLPPRASFCRGS